MPQTQGERPHPPPCLLCSPIESNSVFGALVKNGKYQLAAILPEPTGSKQQRWARGWQVGGEHCRLDWLEQTVAGGLNLIIGRFVGLVELTRIEVSVHNFSCQDTEEL